MRETQSKSKQDTERREDREDKIKAQGIIIEKQVAATKELLKKGIYKIENGNLRNSIIALNL